MTEKMSFDEYLAAHNVNAGDGEGETFAAYLHYLSDGTWDGEATRVDATT